MLSTPVPRTSSANDGGFVEHRSVYISTDTTLIDIEWSAMLGQHSAPLDDDDNLLGVDDTNRNKSFSWKINQLRQGYAPLLIDSGMYFEGLIPGTHFHVMHAARPSLT